MAELTRRLPDLDDVLIALGAILLPASLAAWNVIIAGVVAGVELILIGIMIGRKA